MTDKAILAELAKATDLTARLRQRAGWWSDSDPDPDAVMTDDEEADLYRAAADALDVLLEQNARLADALQAAQRDFERIIATNLNHRYDPARWQLTYGEARAIALGAESAARLVLEQQESEQ